MHTTTLTRPHANPRSRLQRAWQALLYRGAALRLAWLDRRRFEREHRERAQMAELDPRLLRDIGVPDWLEAEAQALRDACRSEREQLRAGGPAIDTRYW